PILPAARHNAMVEAVAAALDGNAFRHEARYRNPPERGMTGSGLLIVGITAQAAEALLRAWEPLAPVLQPAPFERF
ncbi:MAG: hypothetical protein AAF968_22500, partial [Pseudomonadota bacterium]